MRRKRCRKTEQITDRITDWITEQSTKPAYCRRKNSMMANRMTYNTRECEVD